MAIEIDAAPDYVATEDVAEVAAGGEPAEREPVDEEAQEQAAEEAAASGTDETKAEEPKPEGEGKGAEVPDEAVERERIRLEARTAQQRLERAQARIAELEAAAKKGPQSKVAARIEELVASGMSEAEAFRQINQDFLAKKLVPETPEQRREREAIEREEAAKRREQAAIDYEFQAAEATVREAAAKQLESDRYPALASLGAQDVAGLAARRVIEHYRSHGSLEGVSLEGILEEEEQRAYALLQRAAASPALRAKLGIASSPSPTQKGAPSQTSPSSTAADPESSRTIMVTARDAQTRQVLDGDDSFDDFDDYASLDAKLAKKYGL